MPQECAQGWQQRQRTQGNYIVYYQDNTSKGGKSGQSKGNDKPRTVYFTVNGYEDDKATASTAYMVVKVEDKSADEMLDEMIREAQTRSQVESMRPENLPQRLQDEHAALVAQLSAPEDMWQRSASRMCYLDLYLARYENRQDPEWQDAYQEMVRDGTWPPPFWRTRSTESGEMGGEGSTRTSEDP